MSTHRRQWRTRSLRVHSFLAGIPLHDIWSIELPGNAPGRTTLDLLRMVSFESLQRANPSVHALFRLRLALGQLLGWDGMDEGVPDTSYLHRLSELDRSTSLLSPGSLLPNMKGSRLLYATPREAVMEIINKTVHAFVCLAFDETKNASAGHLAVYVRKVSRWTPFYLALIDPFRKLVVYPALLRSIKKTWTVGTSAGIQFPRRSGPR